MDLRKMKKNMNAVSPVIATLMLVLVAVAAAGVFFVWQSQWQEDTTDNIDSEDIKTTLQLGGSSTVYPVSVDAAEAFMQDFPQYKIEVKAGGSDSGCMGAGEGILDIGAASKPVPEGYWDKYDDLVQITIGYDAVVPMVHKDNEHGLYSINRLDLGAVYVMNGNLVGAGGNDPDSAFMVRARDLDENGTNSTPDGVLQWKELPSHAGSSTEFCDGDENIRVADRNVGSGTEECFGDKLMDDFYSSIDHEFDISGVNSFRAENNQGILDALEEHDLVFMAYGLVGDHEAIPFAEHGGVSDLYDDTAVADDTECGLPSYAEIAVGTWTGSRPLNYVVKGEPTGLTYKFINYVLWTSNNMDFLGDNGYVSLYKAEESGNDIWSYSYNEAVGN